MFQMSFIIPSAIQFDVEKLAYWQREFLVHVSVESVPAPSAGGGGRFGSNGSGGSGNNNSNAQFHNSPESSVHHQLNGAQPRRHQHHHQNKAVLRSFEFCLNNVYFVRSLLLGFKKTVQSKCYDFMQDIKPLIPVRIKQKLIMIFILTKFSLYTDTF